MMRRVTAGYDPKLVVPAKAANSRKRALVFPGQLHRCAPIPVIGRIALPFQKPPARIHHDQSARLE